MKDTPVVPRDVRRIFDGRIFSVVVESIILPGGQSLDAELVRHPGSVVLVPVTDHGDVILVRQYRHAIGRWVWELPAGSLKPAESIELAAARECHEETGLIPGKLEKLAALFPTPGYCDEEMHFFKASALRAPTPEEVAHPDEDEDIETQAFSSDTIRQMIRSGEIIDLKTVGGLSLLFSV